MDEDIVLSYNNISLRKSDIDTFKEYTQLNDLSISFYFEILNEKFSQYENMFTLLDPATVFLLIFETDFEDLISMLKPLKLESKEYIFIPVNDIDSKFKVGGGNHWALLLYQKKDQSFYYIDSMLSYIKNTNIIVNSLSHILGLSNIAKVICFDDEKHQQNTYDCGMFVLSYTETLLNKLNKEKYEYILSKEVFKCLFQGISQKSISLLRKEILRLILSLKNK